MEKDISEEEKSNSKLIDLSIKRVTFGFSQINANSEVKDQINNNYKIWFKKINKYITNILELDKNEELRQIIQKLNFGLCKCHQHPYKF